MGILGDIEVLFQPDGPVDITEYLSEFSVKYDFLLVRNYSEEEISNFTSKIPEEDNFIFSLSIEGEDFAVLNSANEDIGSFLVNINEEYETSKDEQESVICTIKFSISKSGKKGTVNVYSFSAFSEFWSEWDLRSALTVLRENGGDNGLSFIFQEEGLEEFHSEYLYFGYTKKGKVLKCDEIFKIKENCHFGSVEMFPFSPRHFYLISRPSTDTPITKKLDLLALLFSVVSIFDITSFSDRELSYKLIGYKSFEGIITYEDLKITSLEVYFKIFKWIYLNDGIPNDKLGLTRNILSLYLKDSTLEIQDNVYYSIQSGFKTYLKENVSKYIELRNKITDELGWISQRAGEIVESHLSNYQKSTFTFLSFFISVFVLRILSTKKFTDVFTKDATLLSFAFILISLAYMLFSIIKLNRERARLLRKYENIKSRYEDLLIKDDIDKILNGDAEFKYEDSYIKSQRKLYSWLWGVTLLLLLLCVITLSSEYNWSYLF